MAKIEVDNIYKFFGRNPKQALDLFLKGTSQEQLAKTHGTVTAVIDASFKVEEGEIFVVMGLSGSGKSTLVRTLNRLFEPTGGTITIDGTDVTALDSKELRELRAHKISMVFQHFALFPHRTVLENAAWGLEVSKTPETERVKVARESLRLVGLKGWEDRYPGQLSGGMQQRVGLARALATDADIMLMDEAFSALDPLIRREMQDQLIDLQDNLHKTIVFITHDLNEAMRMGDRIAMLKNGRVVQIGSAENILSNPANDYVASFIQDVDRSRVLTASAVMQDPVVTILEKEGPQAAARIMREHQISGALVVGPQRRRLVGAVSDDVVIQAAREGRADLRPFINTDLAYVAPDTPLQELLVTSANSPVPLPVVENGRLVGVIPRVTLLAALGKKIESEGTEEAAGTEKETGAEGGRSKDA